MEKTKSGACASNKIYSHKVVCKYHPDVNLIEDCSAGDMICPQCGLVVGERMIDVNAEWRSFSNTDGSRNDDPSRVGAAENPLLGGSDLSTVIGSSQTGRQHDNAGYSKLRSRFGVNEIKYQIQVPYHWVMLHSIHKFKGILTCGARQRGSQLNATDRLLKTAFAEISTMADRISLPRTVSTRAQEIFKRVFDTQTLKGKSTDTIATSCVYIACRAEGVPRTLKEIIAISKVRKKEIGKTTQQILKCIDMSIDVISSRDFMSRFCSNLSLTHQTQMVAKHISQRVSDLNLASGRSPISIAATAIFLASQASAERRTTKEVSDICGVAESTIRLVYKLIQDQFAQLFPPDYTLTTPLNQLPVF